MGVLARCRQAGANRSVAIRACKLRQRRVAQQDVLQLPQLVGAPHIRAALLQLRLEHLLMPRKRKPATVNWKRVHLDKAPS